MADGIFGVELSTLPRADHIRVCHTDFADGVPGLSIVFIGDDGKPMGYAPFDPAEALLVAHDLVEMAGAIGLPGASMLKH